MKHFFLLLITLLVSSTTIVSAATINVEKRGWWNIGPFDITVTCVDVWVFPFSLAQGESSSFIHPDAITIDCSISETMSIEQATYFTSTVGDTRESDDGVISGADSTLADGHTLYVTNTPKWWWKPSSISSIVSSIPSTSTETESTWANTPPTTNSTEKLVSLVTVQDPYTCGEWFVGQVASADIWSTTVTIDLQQAGKSVKLFTPVLSNNGSYNQSIDYKNILAPTYVQAGIYDVVVTANYKWTTDTMSYTAHLTDQCDLYTSTPNPSYLDMLKDRNAEIIWAQNNTWTVMKPDAPKSLPQTGASI